MLTHFSLFSGIGGIDLAAEWAGFTTVGQVEWADYPTKVLEKHWPNVPRWRDIRELTYDKFYKRTGLRTVDLISGGDPCQPHSLANRDRKGTKDERFLWPEYLRLVKDIRPNYVLNENVEGSISNGVVFKKVNDLEQEGYYCTVFSIPAFAVGAWHFRQRVFIVANADSKRLQGGRSPEASRKCGRNMRNNLRDYIRHIHAAPTASQKHKKIRLLTPSEENGTHGKALPGRLGEHYPEIIGRYPNPQFLEWMMGFPIGWSDVSV